MLRDESHWLSITDAFHAAALEGQSWYSALEGLADATGSKAGELIVIGPNAAVPVNIMTNVDPGLSEAFATIRGGDPEVNPRVAAGMRAPPLKVLAESDFITVDEHARHPHYREFARPWDIPFICLATLERRDDLLIGLAVIRSQRQGHITDEQRQVFASVAPHVRAAVRTQNMLEGNGAAVLAGALEALSIPAFICDGTGSVQAMTPAAEALVSGGHGLQLKQKRLRAPQPAEAKALDDAIEAAARKRVRPGPPAQSTLVVRQSERDASPLVLDVVALPAREYELGFAPRVMIVARGARRPEERTAILRAAYSLTSTETQIALQLLEGKTPEAIAAARGVTVGTVRVQIKSILAKVGVSRQVELIARLGSL